jgi:anti-sigma B factor antagonist
MILEPEAMNSTRSDGGLLRDHAVPTVTAGARLSLPRRTMFQGGVDAKPGGRTEAAMSISGAGATLYLTMHPFVVIDVEGELDIATAGKLQTALTTIAAVDGTRIVVDLAGVSFIDVRGLRALLIGRRELARRHIGIVVRNPRPQARRLFDLAGNGDLLDDPGHAQSPRLK